MIDFVVVPVLGVIGSNVDEVCTVSRGGNGRVNGTPFQPNIYSFRWQARHFVAPCLVTSSSRSRIDGFVEDRSIEIDPREDIREL